MTRNKYVKSLIVSAIQIIVYILLCEVAWYIRSYSVGPWQGVTWGITYFGSIFIIASIIVIGNIVFELFLYKIRYSSVILLISSLVIFLLFFAKSIQSTPYRTGVLILSALISLFIKYVIEKKHQTFWNKMEIVKCLFDDIYIRQQTFNYYYININDVKIFIPDIITDSKICKILSTKKRYVYSVYDFCFFCGGYSFVINRTTRDG